MSSHDYTGCQEEACDLCAAHGAGRAKGLFEAAIAVGHMSVTPECRCSPWLRLHQGQARPSLSVGGVSGVAKRGWQLSLGLPLYPARYVQSVGHNSEVSH